MDAIHLEDASSRLATSLTKAGVTYACWQPEIAPTTGMVHLQGNPRG